MNMSHEQESGSYYTSISGDYAQHSASLQDMTGSPLSKVLVIYCGGTIGMRHSNVHGYYPVPGFLSKHLLTNPSFNDQAFVQFLEENEEDVSYEIASMDKSIGPILAMPPSIYGKRVAYQILEYSPLKDSCNVNVDDWAMLAGDIEKYYHCYDAFVILHGTDTMAYSSSALSFLLENLGKSVIFTGSQIPFSELRNDAKDNLLGALILAGHFVIPEVCLYFANRLFRGNRCSKINAVALGAFDSPNHKPLVKMGVNIHIEWADIMRSTSSAPAIFHKTMDPNVGVLRLFPGITVQSVESFLGGNIKAVVLQTFGAGNAPIDRPELLQALSLAIKRGVIIVNITQCIKGNVTNLYSTGHALQEIGVVPGVDMTTESALAKLGYLLARFPGATQRVSDLMSESLRGELTQTVFANRKGSNASCWLGSVFNSSVMAASAGHKFAVDKLLRPLFMHVAASQNDVLALEQLSTDFIDAFDYENRTSLHVAVRAKAIDAVKWLISNGASVHVRDVYGKTALVDILQSFKIEKCAKSRAIIDELVKVGARLPPISKSITNELYRAVRIGDIEIISLLKSLGFELSCVGTEGRNILHIAVIHGQLEIIKWLQSNVTFKVFVNSKDSVGHTPLMLAKLMNNVEIISELEHCE